MRVFLSMVERMFRWRGHLWLATWELGNYTAVRKGKRGFITKKFEVDTQVVAVYEYEHGDEYIDLLRWYITRIQGARDV